MKLEVGVKGIQRGLKLSDVSVPPQLRKKVSCGIGWWDNSLGNITVNNKQMFGLTPSAVVMLTGTPGAGKTTAMLQVADAYANAGHNVLYNTGEESMYQVKLVAERLKLKCNFVIGQDTLVGQIIEHADWMAAQSPGKQTYIFLDSLQTLDDGKYPDGHTNSATALRSVEMLTQWAKATYNNVTFIGQVNKDGEFQGKNGILHAIDVRARLFIDKDKKSETLGERIFEVTKNRMGGGAPAYVLGMGSRGLFEKGVYGELSSDDE
jgi:DNA repair protein RadA/Sms